MKNIVPSRSGNCLLSGVPVRANGLRTRLLQIFLIDHSILVMGVVDGLSSRNVSRYRIQSRRVSNAPPIFHWDPGPANQSTHAHSAEADVATASRPSKATGMHGQRVGIAVPSSLLRCVLDELYELTEVHTSHPSSSLLRLHPECTITGNQHVGLTGPNVGNSDAGFATLTKPSFVKPRSGLVAGRLGGQGSEYGT